MGIDRNAFKTLALSMFLAPAIGCGGAAPAGDVPAPQAAPAPVEVETAPADEAWAPAVECIEWDPTGECINWEGWEGMAGPADECVDWDPTGECIGWE